MYTKLFLYSNSVGMEGFFTNTSFILLFFTMLSYWTSTAFKDLKLKIPFFPLSSLSFSSFLMILSNFSLMSLLILRWINSGHFPLSNLYESLMFLAWSCTCLHFILLNMALINVTNPIMFLQNEVIDKSYNLVEKKTGFSFSTQKIRRDELIPEAFFSQKAVTASDQTVSSSSLRETIETPNFFVTKGNLQPKEKNPSYPEVSVSSLNSLKEDQVEIQPISTEQKTSFSFADETISSIVLPISQTTSTVKGFPIFAWPVPSSEEQGKRLRNVGSYTLEESFIGCITAPCSLLMNAYATFSLPQEMQQISPLVPALQSNWLMMHVTVMIISYSALILGSLLSLAFLILTLDWSVFKKRILSYPAHLGRWQKSSTESLKGSDKDRPEIKKTWLKIAENLDNYSYRILGIGFPFLTIGILSGAVWANEAWGSYWSWDPKETWALLTWFVYAIYLHTRITKGWQGKKPAMIASLGFIFVWICFLGVNLIGEGLHSYGWFS